MEYFYNTLIKKTVNELSKEKFYGISKIDTVI